tara:strand:+ start:2176 stop:2817 length:642 start_codon:yes stop_codon:yes gene_type:complete
MSSIYQLHYANGTALANVTLEWTSSSSTWQDHGTDQPVYLTKNSTSGSTTTSVSGVVANDRIRGFKTNTSIQRGDFIHPSGNLDVVNTQILEQSDTFGIGAGGYWKCISTTVSGSGGGTSTEGSSYSGTLTVNGTSLEYEIPGTSSSGTYELKADGTTQLSIVHGSTASTGSAPNFDQTKIWTLISPIGDELDEIDLTGSGGSLTKKVFCNFW